MTLDEFSRLASEKLKLDINVKQVYKICDFKPTYGVIFEDCLIGYDFWGHVDLDMLFGDIRKFISDYMLERYHLISAFNAFVCGHFTLYKNCEEMNTLFNQSAGFKMILTDGCNHYFDEVGFAQTVDKFVQEKRLSVFMKNLSIVGAIDTNWINHFMPGFDFKNLKTGACFWKEGKLFHLPTKEEAMCLHFLPWKGWDFFVPTIKVNNTIKRIEINAKGFKVICSSFFASVIYSVEFFMKKIGLFLKTAKNMLSLILSK
jgi:hypothetical protein